MPKEKEKTDVEMKKEIIDVFKKKNKGQTLLNKKDIKELAIQLMFKL